MTAHAFRPEREPALQVVSVDYVPPRFSRFSPELLAYAASRVTTRATPARSPAQAVGDGLDRSRFNGRS